MLSSDVHCVQAKRVIYEHLQVVSGGLSRKVNRVSPARIVAPVDSPHARTHAAKTRPPIGDALEQTVLDVPADCKLCGYFAKFEDRSAYACLVSGVYRYVCLLAYNSE